MSRAREATFRHDHVLGTSLDLWLTAPAAEAAEAAVLAEVERLRRVFSLHDADSELSALNRAAGSVSLSSELGAVLAGYARIQPLAGGALNPLVGALTRAWADAERDGREPAADVLARLVADIHAEPRTTAHPLDLNAGAKGFILDRAAGVARAAGATAGLVNLGGDLIGWGASPWPVGVQDPFAPAENARPLGAIRLHNASVATSGGYQRGYTVNGARWSHLIDPRTGRPAARVASATAVAADSLTANLLATALAVLAPADGLRLVAAVPGAAGLIVDMSGEHFTSPGFALLPVEFATPAAAVPAPRHRVRNAVAAGTLATALFVAAADPGTAAPVPVAVATEAAVQDAPAKAEAWPAGFQLTVALELPKIDGARKYRRPYVAVWVEDSGGKAVKTVAVWGNNDRWIKDLSDWWKIGKTDAELVKAVTRATRNPGKYELGWDGKDEKGRPVPQGEYTVRVEVHREHGKHVRQAGKIALKAAPATLKLGANDETGETVVSFGKAEKK